MTPLHEINDTTWAIAWGLIGDRSRVMAMFLVAFEGMSERRASKRTGVPRSTINDDRRRFHERLRLYQQGVSVN